MATDLRSISKARVVDVISEGPIEGLIDEYGNVLTTNLSLGKGVFLDESPLTSNDQASYEDITISFTQGRQGLLQSRDQFLSDKITENLQVGARITYENGWISPQIPDHVEQVRLTFTVPGLYKRNEDQKSKNYGELENDTVKYTIATGETPSTLALYGYGDGERNVTGTTTSTYAFDREVIIGTNNVRYIEVKRTNVEADITDQAHKNDFYLSGYAYIQNTQISYAGSSTVQLQFDAENLRGIPKRGYRIRGKQVVLPVGYDGTKRFESFYDQVWDGSVGETAKKAYEEYFNDSTIGAGETIYKITVTNPGWIDDTLGDNTTNTCNTTFKFSDGVDEFTKTFSFSTDTAIATDSSTNKPFMWPSNNYELIDYYGNWTATRIEYSNVGPYGSSTSGAEYVVATGGDLSSGDERVDGKRSDTGVNGDFNIEKNGSSYTILDKRWEESTNSSSTIESGRIKAISTNGSPITLSKTYAQLGGIREGQEYTVKGKYKPSSDGSVTMNFFSTTAVTLSSNHVGGADGSGYYEFSFTQVAGWLDTLTLNVPCSAANPAFFEWLRIEYTAEIDNIGWTTNPGWIFYDLITNKRYGLGRYINKSFVDKWTIYKMAKYCDAKIDAGVGTATIIPDGNPTIAGNTNPYSPVTVNLKKPLILQVGRLYPDQPITMGGEEYFLADYAYSGQKSIKVYNRDSNGASSNIDGTTITFTIVEPRFSINTYLQRQEDAFKLLQNVASAFRAMVYWAGGIVQLSQDTPKNPIAEFTNANVINGRFEYATAARKTRHTAAIIRYADETDYYKPKLETVEDGESIFKFGYRPIELAAFGATSRGQARRLGEWLLYTENREAQVLTFRTALEGAYLRPGDIIKVMDKNKSNRYFGGRVLSIDTSTPTAPILTLDKPVRIIEGYDYTFTAVTPRANKEVTDISVSSQIEDLRKSQIAEFTVKGWSAADNGDLGASDTFDEGSGRISSKIKLTGTLTDFEKIKKYTTWMIESPDEVSAQQFRLITIEEVKSNEFEIVASKYDINKFTSVENGISETPTATSNYPKLQTINPVENLKALLVEKGSGDYGLLATWSRPSNTFVSHYLIRWQVGSSEWSQQQRSDNPSYEIPYAPLSGKYTIQVVAVGTSGRTSASKQIVFGTDQTSTAYTQIVGGEDEEFYAITALTLVDDEGGGVFNTTTPQFSWTRESLPNRIFTPISPFTKSVTTFSWSAHTIHYEKVQYPINSGSGLTGGEYLYWTIGSTAYTQTSTDPRTNINLDQDSIVTIAYNRIEGSDALFDFLGSDKLGDFDYLQDSVNFVDFQVTVTTNVAGDPVGGTLVLTKYINEFTHTFDYAELYAAVSGLREFAIQVRSRYLVHTGGDDAPDGYLGIPTGIIVSNPAPAAIASNDISIIARGTVNELSFVPSDADADYAGNLVLVGPDVNINLASDSILDSAKANKVAIDATEKDKYYTIASYDTWGKTDLNYSPWPPETLTQNIPPNEPTTLAQTKTEGGLLLSWSHVSPDADIEGYEIWKCPNNSLFTTNTLFNWSDVLDTWQTSVGWDGEGKLVNYILKPDFVLESPAGTFNYEVLIAGYNPLSTEYYWIRSVDTSKNKSLFEPATTGLPVEAESVEIQADTQVFLEDADGTLVSTPSYITITGSKSNFTSALTWKTSGSVKLRSGTSIGSSEVTTGDTVYMHWADVDTADVDGISIEVKKSDNAAIRDQKNFYVLRGAQATVSAWLTNQSHTYVADSNGVIPTANYADGKTLVQVYMGTTELEYALGTTTAGEYTVVLTDTSLPGSSISLELDTEAGTPNRASIKPVDDTFVGDAATYNVEITYYYLDSNQVTQSATTIRALNYSKSKGGTSAETLDIISSGYVFAQDQDGAIDPPYIVLDTERANVSPNVTWKITNGILYENQVADWNFEDNDGSFVLGTNATLLDDGVNSYDGNNYVVFANSGGDTDVSVTTVPSALKNLQVGDFIFIAARCKKSAGGTFSLFGPTIELRTSGGTPVTTIETIAETVPGNMADNQWKNIYGSYELTSNDINVLNINEAKIKVKIKTQSADNFYVDSIIAFLTNDNLSEITTPNGVVLYSGNFNVDNVEITASAT